MSQEWPDPQGPSGSRIDSSSLNKSIINSTDSLGHSFSRSKIFSLDPTGGGDVNYITTKIFQNEMTSVNTTKFSPSYIFLSFWTKIEDSPLTQSNKNEVFNRCDDLDDKKVLSCLYSKENVNRNAFALHNVAANITNPRKR